MKRPFRTHYDNLKVSHDAPEEVIKAAYRQLVLKYHPDKHGNSEQANRRLTIIKDSYDVLIDPISRKEHDEWIKRKYDEFDATKSSGDKSSYHESKANYKTDQESDNEKRSQQGDSSTFSGGDESDSNDDDSSKSNGTEGSRERGNADKSVIANFHPWRRYFAKTIDYVLYSMVVNIIVMASIVYNLDESVHYAYLDLTDIQAFYAVLSNFYWFVAEVFVLGVSGTSPGRWLYNIHIRNSDGLRLGFSESVQRSASLYFKGLGMGLPVIIFITSLFGYKQLTKEGITSWDADQKLIVSHGDMSILRYMGVAVVLLSIIAVSAYFLIVGE
jgi:hypothetical protein